MESPQPPGAALDRDTRTRQRALELSARKHLTPNSIDKLLATVPDDWQPGEADVDEFLEAIRNH